METGEPDSALVRIPTSNRMLGGAGSISFDSELRRYRGPNRGCLKAGSKLKVGRSKSTLVETLHG